MPYLGNVFDTVNGVLDKLKKHYLNQVKSLIVPIIGSFGIFGSPISFFARISNSVIDLMERT